MRAFNRDLARSAEPQWKAFMQDLECELHTSARRGRFEKDAPGRPSRTAFLLHRKTKFLVADFLNNAYLGNVFLILRRLAGMVNRASPPFIRYLSRVISFQLFTYLRNNPRLGLDMVFLDAQEARFRPLLAEGEMLMACAHIERALLVSEQA
jgi:hypothetical protein